MGRRERLRWEDGEGGNGEVEMGRGATGMERKWQWGVGQRGGGDGESSNWVRGEMTGLSISFGVAGEFVKVGGQTFWGVRGHAPSGKFLKL